MGQQEVLVGAGESNNQAELKASVLAHNIWFSSVYLRFSVSTRKLPGVVPHRTPSLIVPNSTLTITSRSLLELQPDIFQHSFLD